MTLDAETWRPPAVTIEAVRQLPSEGARIIEEAEFAAAIRKLLKEEHRGRMFGAVTGPGRSGAIASVYASHILGIPFVPYKQKSPSYPLLIIDTAEATGATLRKAKRWYQREGGGLKDHHVTTLSVFNEPPRVRFWYEFRRINGQREYN